MKPSQTQIRKIKELAAELPPVFKIVKESTGGKDTVIRQDHFKVILGYLQQGKMDKLDQYLADVSTINVSHEKMIQGMNERLRSIL
jgi:hypothetical protein